MDYFDTPEVSASMLKALKREYYGVESPDNLEEIFAFGHLVERVVLDKDVQAPEGSKDPKEWNLAIRMMKAFYKDPFLTQIMTLPGKREHSWHRSNLLGVRAKCRADWWVDRIKLILEFKGLAATTQRGFEYAINFFDYDMAAAWYLDVAQVEKYIIVGCSKAKPERVFKRAVLPNDDDPVYATGKKKCIIWVDRLLMMDPESWTKYEETTNNPSH